ncbi:MAG: hypothetical protein QG620_684 [Patescibacteria group bacterium]|nr:hypothetical protein [Patescibacteria group bacterium]
MSENRFFVKLTVQREKGKIEELELTFIKANKNYGEFKKPQNEKAELG